MAARINSFSFQHIEVVPVEMQVHIASGLPALILVSLLDKAVAKTGEWVRAAIGGHTVGFRVICPTDNGGEVAWAGSVKLLAGRWGRLRDRR